MDTPLCAATILFFLGFANADCSVASNQVTFYLRTRDLNNEEIQITDTNLHVVDPTKLTKVLIHGFMNDHLILWYNDSIAALLDKDDYNVIIVDWSEPAHESYDDAADCLPQVGTFVGLFIYKLQTRVRVSLDDLHVIGHSFGAHVAGFAGKKVRELSNSQIARITALDAASKKYADITDPDGKLYKTDAKFVDAIHTDGGGAGLLNPVGVIDFYPNGGVSHQPGCTNNGNACSHERSAFLFAEEIRNSKGFLATKCDSFANFEAGLCDNQVTINMGGENDATEEGTYYLYTNSESPFSRE